MGFFRRQQSGDDNKIIRQESNVNLKEEYKKDEIQLEDTTDGEFEREEGLSIFTNDNHMPSCKNKIIVSGLRDRLSMYKFLYNYTKFFSSA